MKAYNVYIKAYNLYISSSNLSNKLNIVVQSPFCKKIGVLSS